MGTARLSDEGSFDGAKTIFTIGYGNRRMEDFLALVQEHAITAICDVRSTPYSRRFTSFNRESLADALASIRARYLFFGDLLGARPTDSSLYIQGRASYELMESSPPFKSGLGRLHRGVELFTIALMCAEKDPLDCHRAILVGRALTRAGATITHIGPNGGLETQEELEQRLLRKYQLDQSSLLAPLAKADAIEQAYARRASELAYDVAAANREKASP